MAILDTIKKTLHRDESAETKPEAKNIADEKKMKKAARPRAGRSSVKFDFGLLKSPHVTEKSSFLQADRKYVFKVDDSANKPEIKKAIEGIYKVKVTDVNILQKRSKKVRLGKHEGVSSVSKKAIVTLKEGDKIEINA